MIRSTILLCLLAVSVCGAEELYLDRHAEAGGFVTTRGELTEEKTNVSISSDRDNLILRFRCELADQTKLIATEKKDDDTSIFGGEVLEVTLSPKPESGIYYHLAINPEGALYSAQKREMSWNPANLKRKVEKQPGFWTAELIIPFAAFGESTPKKGDRWKINFARTRVGNGSPTAASWSGAKDFHDISQYGDLIFAPAPGTRILVEELTRKGTELHAEIKTYAMREPVLIEVGINGRILERNVLSKTSDVMKFRRILDSAYVPLKETYEIQLTAKNHRTGQLIQEKRAVIAGNHSDVFTLDRYYCTPADKAIRYRHAMAGNTPVITVSRDGNTVMTLKNVAQNGSIPLSGLKPGRYVITLQAGKNRTSRVLLLLDKTPVSEPIAAEAELKISGDIFTLGGKPVFLLSASPTGKSFLHYGDAFNLNYGTYGVQANPIVLQGLPGGRLVRQPATGYLYPAKAEHEKILNRFLASPAPKRGFTRLAYEAQMKAYRMGKDKKLTEMNPPEFYADLYRYVKKQAPDRYYSIHIDHHTHLKEFAKIGDIFETSYWSSSFSPTMIPNLDRDMKEAKAAAGSKPVVFWLGGTIPNNACRTAEEIRAGIYLAVINNIAGVIIHMGHGYLPQERSRLWSLISGVNADIQTFFAEYHQGTPDPSFVTSVTPGFAYGVRRTGKSVLVIVVNLTGTEQKLVMKTKSAEINDLFTPYEPKVFSLNP